MASKRGGIIRPATLQDVKAINDLVLPFVSHDGFHDYFFPHQDEYPEDMYDWWYRYHRKWILNPYTMMLVAETESKEIVGMALWSFAPRAKGDTDAPEPIGVDLAKNTYKEIAQRKYYASVDWAVSKLFPNRALDPDALAEWGKTVSSIVSKHWSGSNRVHWYCPDLGITTAHKEEFFGDLLQWGIKQAEIDGTPTFAGCTSRELEDYQKEGFVVLDTIKCGPSEGFLLTKGKRDGQSEKAI